MQLRQVQHQVGPPQRRAGRHPAPAPRRPRPARRRTRRAACRPGSTTAVVSSSWSSTQAGSGPPTVRQRQSWFIAVSTSTVARPRASAEVRRALGRGAEPARVEDQRVHASGAPVTRQSSPVDGVGATWTASRSGESGRHWLDSTAGPPTTARAPTTTTRRLNRAHGNDERPQERHGAQPRRPALAGHLVPAPQARQGRRGRALQAQEHRVRQDRRQDLQRRRAGRGGERRQADDAVPLQRRHVVRLHGHRHLRPGRGRPGDRGRRDQLPPGEPGGDRGQQRRPGPLHRAAGLGRARGHLHRAGPAGRPLDRRHQAGHRRDRRDRDGPAVHRQRREDQGRHPRQLLPRPRSPPSGCPLQGAQACPRRALRLRAARRVGGRRPRPRDQRG